MADEENEGVTDGEDALKGEDVKSGTGLQPKAPEGSDETGPSENPKADEPEL